MDTPLALVLPWLKDVSGAGEFLADRNGYFRAAGFGPVDLIAGGPQAPQAEALVSAGRALAGVSAPDLTAGAAAQGAEVTIVGAQLQRGPFCVMSLAANPLSTPQDLVGRRIGVQASNQPVWEAFLAANGIDAAAVTAVPADFNPAPLLVGEVDGWLSYINNEPVALAAQGTPTVTMLFADHGYNVLGAVYVVRTAALTEQRDAVRGVLASLVAGWRDAIADPAAAARLAVDDYGRDQGLDLAVQTRVMETTAALMTPADPAAGLLTLTDAAVADTVASLRAAGVVVDPAVLFDPTPLAEVYRDRPDLR